MGVLARYFAKRGFCEVRLSCLRFSLDTSGVGSDCLAAVEMAGKRLRGQKPG